MTCSVQCTKRNKNMGNVPNDWTYSTRRTAWLGLHEAIERRKQHVLWPFWAALQHGPLRPIENRPTKKGRVGHHWPRCRSFFSYPYVWISLVYLLDYPKRQFFFSALKPEITSPACHTTVRPYTYPWQFDTVVFLLFIFILAKSFKNRSNHRKIYNKKSSCVRI